MTKKITQILAAVFITLLLVTTAFGATPVGSVSARPYTYENQMYSFFEYTSLESEEGSFCQVRDKNAEIVTDVEIVRKIAYADFFLMSSKTNQTSIAAYSNSAANIRPDAANYKAAGTRLENNASLHANPQVVKDLANSFYAFESIFLKEADAYDKLAEIQKDVVNNGNRSYENAQKLEAQYRELINVWEQEANAFRQLQKSENAFYDMIISNSDSYGIDINKTKEEQRRGDAGYTNTINEIENDIRNLKSYLEQDKNEHIAMAVNYVQPGTNETNKENGTKNENKTENGKGTENNSNSIPGFSLLIAVSALLIAGFFIKKQKK
jgi:hypothetical protein